MPVRFTCPHCGVETQVADEFLGQTGPCVQCERPVTIPSAADTQNGPETAKGPSRPATLVLLALAALVVVAGFALATSLLLSNARKARAAAQQSACGSNLRRIGAAMQNYYAQHGSFPPAYLADEDGTRLHSWRVLLLPHLGYEVLYDAFDLERPWDDPRNSGMTGAIPDVYRCPGQPAGPFASYMMVIGPGVASDGPTPTELSQIKDRASNTLMIIEVGGTSGTWLDPAAVKLEELLQPGSVARLRLGSNHAGMVNMLYCDGTVRAVRAQNLPQFLKDTSAVAGGQTVSQLPPGF